MEAVHCYSPRELKVDSIKLYHKSSCVKLARIDSAHIMNKVFSDIELR